MLRNKRGLTTDFHEKERILIGGQGEKNNKQNQISNSNQSENMMEGNTSFIIEAIPKSDS